MVFTPISTHNQPSIGTFVVQPITRSMSAGSITMGSMNPSSMASTITPESEYVYNNVKSFKTTSNLSNSQIENIWEHYFNKKNKGYCQNCDIYPISRPVNTRMKCASWRVPPGIIVETGRDTTINTDKYTFVCYICYNEHLISKTSICDATAPMDTREGGNDKVEESYFDNFKKYNK
jgi:hypothetical protein